MPKKVRVPPRNPERTRQRLLTAAIALFSQRGYHAVSVDEIVASARVNKRMVYHYFGSKEALYKTVLREVYSRLEKVEFHVIESAGSPREKLARLLDSYFAFLDENPEFVQLLQWENLERGRHIAKDHHLLTKNPFMERFREIVSDGVKTGVFRDNLNITHLVIHFIGLCFIYYSNRYSLSQGLNLDLGSPQVKAEARHHALSLVFNGIGADLPDAGH
jgi:AcrR family transcriptional regulator